MNVFYQNKCNLSSPSNNLYRFGLSSRNRTCIPFLGGTCSIHWTTERWYPHSELNRENSSFWGKRLCQFVHRGIKFGATSWTRTSHTQIFSLLLYLMSYRGKIWCFYQESNLGFARTKGVYCHCTIKAGCWQLILLYAVNKGEYLICK